MPLHKPQADNRQETEAITTSNGRPLQDHVGPLRRRVGKMYRKIKKMKSTNTMLLLSAPPCEKQPSSKLQAQIWRFHSLSITIQSFISPSSYSKSSLSISAASPAQACPTSLGRDRCRLSASSNRLPNLAPSGGNRRFKSWLISVFRVE